MKKSIILFILIIFGFTFFGCGSSKQVSEEKKLWKHFKVVLNLEENSEVKKLQDSLDVVANILGNDEELKKLKNSLNIVSYVSPITICVDIRDPKLQTIIIGDEKDPKSIAYRWIEDVPKSVKEYLLNYTGPKKINLDK